jgi:hypothetical protein
MEATYFPKHSFAFERHGVISVKIELFSERVNFFGVLKNIVVVLGAKNCMGTSEVI